MMQKTGASDAYGVDGLPADESSPAYGLPTWLQESVAAMQAAWNKLNRGEEHLHWDMGFCSMRSDISIAEVENVASSEQAWYLRENIPALRP